MYSTTLALIAVLAAAPAPGTGRAYAPLLSINQHLDRGAKAWFAGEADPFAPWTLDGDTGELRGELTAAGVASLEIGGFEFEPHLSGKEDSGTLRTTVVLQGEGVAFVELKFRTESEGWSRSGRAVPLGEWRGQGADFAEAGRRLSKVVTSNACADLPLLDAEAWAGTPMHEKAVEGMKRTREELPAVCASIAAVKPRVTHIKIDDFGLFARDEDGRMIGVVSGELERRDDGGIVVGLSSRFERFPDPPTDAPAAGAVDRSTPEATWSSLLASVAARDIDTYAACWATERREREGMVSELSAKPELWDELDGVLRGPMVSFECDVTEDVARCRVEAPEADGGGIGGFTLHRMGVEWLMWSW